MKWIDILPYEGYYRDMLDASRLELEPNAEPGLFSSVEYNVFETGKERYIKSFISNDNQIAFPVDGYTPSLDNPLIFYVEGVPVEPVQVILQSGGGTIYEAYLPNPIAAGLEVIVIALGTPKLTVQGCRLQPSTAGSPQYPTAALEHKDKYLFDLRKYRETCVALGRSVKRIQLDLFPGEDINSLMYSKIASRQNYFTIHEGDLYVSYDLNEIPCYVTYCYDDNGTARVTTERVVPKSPNGVVYHNDRAFPQLVLNRAEFMHLLNRVRKNLYNRFTDRPYQVVVNNERNISDIPDDKWYSDFLFDILNEKYLDGCYVFPLYEDGSFNPTGCITRAEAVVYLNRFAEWVIERFR